jgi:DNA invertase Pin-like site-specific DNA recombinase
MTERRQVVICARDISDPEVAAQLAELRRVAVERNWEVAAEYHDVAPARARRRVGLQQLMADVHAGRIGASTLVVQNLHVLAPDARGVVAVVLDLLAHGVDVALADNGIDTASDRAALMAMLGALRGLTRAARSERSRLALRHAVRRGRPRVAVDTVRAAELLGTMGLRAAARTMGLSPSTLHRAIAPLRLAVVTERKAA